MSSRVEYAVGLGVPRDVAEKAADSLDRGVFAICISGKLGSGKDSVAEGIFERLGLADAEHVMFSGALKREINEVISYIHSTDSKLTAAEWTADRQGIPFDQAQEIVELLFDEVKSGVIENSKDRTLNSRRALQLWGTEVRRSQDELYWVKRSAQQLAATLAEGRAAYITDARFTNEIGIPLGFGIPVIRLDVSYEEQSRRINGRDGVVVTDEARQHISETQLDGYDGFTMRINTDEATVAEISDRVVQELFAK